MRNANVQWGLVTAASYVIVSKETGKAIFETYNRKVAEQINLAKYDVMPIGNWLAHVNRNVKVDA